MERRNTKLVRYFPLFKKPLVRYLLFEESIVTKTSGLNEKRQII